MAVPQRHDIQVLRGLAVLAVVAYHAVGLPGGFLGVDIFFVISGFLIGRMIISGLSEGTFRFGEFYRRRAWRLLPASFSTLIVTTLLAYLLLTSDQWGDYLDQLVGAVTFTSNFVLYFQSDYFDAGAATRPLLHIWSLSLEEQFYVFAPAVLALFSRRGWLIAAGIAISAGLCFTLVSDVFDASEAPSLAFYMLPARAWELLIGTFAAWIMLNRPIDPPAAAKWVALAVVAALLAYRIDDAHPRFDALIVTLATAVMLLGRDGWIRMPPLARIGDWSYSLYLVHWPLLAFAHISYLETPPIAVRIGLCAVAIVLAWAQYTYVETPFRRGGPALRLSIPAAVLALLCLPAASQAEKLPPAVGLSAACDQSGPWRRLPECATSDSPVIALWGDSYAMQLVPALDGPFIQVTKSGCAPIPGVAQVDDQHPIAWSRECAAFNESALSGILGIPSVKYVLISSRFTQVLQDEDQDLFHDDRQSPWSDIGAEKFAEAVLKLKAAGKTPIIVGPTPNTGFDAGACNRRIAQNLIVLGRSDCDIDRAAAEAALGDSVRALRQVADETGAVLLLPTEILCKADCVTRLGEQPLYRDVGHLTPEGARNVLAGLGPPFSESGTSPNAGQ